LTAIAKGLRGGSEEERLPLLAEGRIYRLLRLEKNQRREDEILRGRPSEVQLKNKSFNSSGRKKIRIQMAKSRDNGKNSERAKTEISKR